MALIYTVNNTVIPAEDITIKGVSEQKLDVCGSEIIAAKMTFTISNADKSRYDDMTPGSLFYGVSWYNAPITVFDDDQGIYTWVGRVKNITVDDGRQTLDIQSSNFLKDAIDTTCIYQATDITPMGAVYDILTGQSLVGIDPVYFNQYTINFVRGQQEGHSLTVDISFTAEKNKNCLAVIEELCRISHSSIYLKDNIIHAYMYEPFDGQLGMVVEDKNILPGTYRHWYDAENLYTDYCIRYKQDQYATSVLTIKGSDAGAIGKGYARRSFNVPDVDNGISVNDYPILINNSTGAQWVAATALDRYGEIQMKGEVKVGRELAELLPGSQADLNFRAYIREPMLVTSNRFDRDRHEIRIQGIFRNLPVRVFTPDVDPPPATAIITVLRLSASSYRVLFVKVEEAESYELYFTHSAGSWDTSFSDQGISFLDIKSPPMNEEGYLYVDISGLKEETLYWYRIRTLDAHRNPSDFSNIFAGLLELTAYENKYYLAGNVWTGLTLDMTNPGGGTPPPSEVLYGEGIYGLDYYGLTAFYVSPVYKLRDYSLLSFTGQGRIILQYRSSLDNLTWSSWSEEIPVNGEGTVDVTSYIYFQFRVIFASLTWNAADTFQLQEIR